MAEFKNDNLSARFTVPDRPTVRQQLAYYSRVIQSTGTVDFEKYWEGAKVLIEEWECEKIPDYGSVNLDKIDDPEITHIIVWVGMQVKMHFDTVERVEKN